MTTQDFKTEIKEIIETERSTFDSAAKEYCNEELEEIGRISAEDIEIQGTALARIFKLEDGMVIIVDSEEMDYCYFSENIEEAQMVATENLLKLNN
jgi:hypothetical protein